MTATTRSKKASKRNMLVALAAALVVATTGYVLVLTKAAGFFASVDPSAAALTGNATLVTQTDSTKAIQFNAPVVISPPPPGSTSCALPNYPEASCTGVPAGVTLTTVNGDMNITTAGAVIEGKDIRGCVSVNAKNVIIRKSKITCSGTAIHNCTNDNESHPACNGAGLLVEDADISCNSQIGGTGITTRTYTARRVNVHHCDNVVWVEENNLVEDSYIHDPICYNKRLDPHTDGIQIPAGGSNITIRHNTIYGNYEMCDEDEDGDLEQSFGNSAITTGSGLSNLLITNNLLAGGGYTLRCAEDGAPSTNYRVIDNHFSTIFTPKVGGFGPWNDCQNETQVTGNVYHQTGQTVSF